MTNFKLFISIVFGFFILAGVLFLVVTPQNTTSVKGDVEIWGTVKSEYMRSLIDIIKTNNINISYEEKEESTYVGELIEAFAGGKGPDVFLLPHELIVRFSDKVYPLSKELISERDFNDTFVEEGRLFQYGDNTLGLPLYIDPLVMYWNRDIFTSANIASPPQYWTSLVDDVKNLVSYTDAGEIISPAVGLGEFVNINHAKDILSLLFLQTGSDIIEVGEEGLEMSFIDGADESVLRFYTEFARPGKDTYTWNRSLDEARDMFVAGDVPIYFGYASELPGMIAQNPHLNIDMATVPQLQSASFKTTYGSLTGVVVARYTDNLPGAQYVQFSLVGEEAVASIAQNLNVAPARTSLLGGVQEDAFKDVYYQSALFSRGWLDPQPETSYTILKDVVESITSGRARVSEAVSTLNRDLQALIKESGVGTGY